MEFRPEDEVEMAKRFKALRGKGRMTQAQLGAIIGICRQSVNKIENRRVYPDYTTIDRFPDLEAGHQRGRRITAALSSSSGESVALTAAMLVAAQSSSMRQR